MIVNKKLKTILITYNFERISKVNRLDTILNIAILPQYSAAIMCYIGYYIKSDERNEIFAENILAIRDYCELETKHDKETCVITYRCRSHIVCVTCHDLTGKLIFQQRR